MYNVDTRALRSAMIDSMQETEDINYLLKSEIAFTGLDMDNNEEYVDAPFEMKSEAVIAILKEIM